VSPLPGPPWLALTTLRPGRGGERTDVRPHRVYAGVLAGALGVLLVVAVVGAAIARAEAESEAVENASQRTEVIADAAIEPVLTDGILTGGRAALRRLDRSVCDYVIGPEVARVKLWAADGTILYSNEPRLVGQRFDLDADELEAIRAGAAGTGTGAEVTDLDEPENVYERGFGKLLEVYHPVRTPGGEVLLFELYAPYDVVSDRSDEIWGGFAFIVVGSLLALLLLMLPVLAWLLRRIRRARDERERLLQAALDASDSERRRIAATLHDGVVQELAATSYAVSGAAARASAGGDRELAGTLEVAAETVRGGIGGLRSLLVDIYPAGLDGGGLRQALDDLAAGLRGRDVRVVLQVAEEASARLGDEQAQLVFQVVRETLRNAAQHARATEVVVSLDRTASGTTLLEVADDGRGFDPAAVLAAPAHGHFGLRLLVDVARRAGASLAVRSGSGAGTTWRLEVPAA